MFHIIDTVNKKDQRLIGLIFGSNRITMENLNFSGDVPLLFFCFHICSLSTRHSLQDLVFCMCVSLIISSDFQFSRHLN